MARTKRTMTQPTNKSASIGNAIINSINEIRKIKRKVPGKESISTLASKRSGLSVTDILTELDSMVESGQLYIEKTATNKDSYFVKNLKKVASSSLDKSIICSSENEEELLENATINQSSIIDQSSDNDDLSNDLSNPINQSDYGHLDVSAEFPSEFVEISGDYEINKYKATFRFRTIEVQEIRDAFATVKTAKSFGIDNISSYFLKLALPFIENSLAFLFNTSIETSRFLDSCKVARATPIFKDGDKTDKSNYRPISVLPVISRLFEKLVTNQLYQ